jgi:hypothetical protein
MEMTVEEYAKAYVDTVLSTPNGWGQHVHPVYGRSDIIMIVMHRKFGNIPTEKAIDKEFLSRR